MGIATGQSGVTKILLRGVSVKPPINRGRGRARGRVVGEQEQGCKKCRTRKNNSNKGQHLSASAWRGGGGDKKEMVVWGANGDLSNAVLKGASTTTQVEGGRKALLLWFAKWWRAAGFWKRAI